MQLPELLTEITALSPGEKQRLLDWLTRELADKDIPSANLYPIETAGHEAYDAAAAMLREIEISDRQP